MPVYFEYALKASLCLAIIFLFYTLLLKRITYYTWNRYFLLLFSVLSFVAPFINVNVFVQVQQLENLSFINQIPLIANNEIPGNFVSNQEVFNYWEILSVVYLLVSSILLVRLLIQLLSITKIKSEATLIANGAVKIYHLSKPVIPFSFLNSIFINQANYSENELQEIIDHERVHVQQKHTTDVLIAEVICILNWYNPFAWLIKKAVRENLEFIADNAVINKGVSRRNYQYLLLKVTGNIPSSITSNLKFSSLKNRINMMNKTKTSRFHLLKFLLLVPVAAILLLAFRNNHDINTGITKGRNPITKTYILNSLSYSIPDKKVEAAVKKEQDKSLLKTGQALSLDLVFNERIRLNNLLESSGYNNIGDHAITFMIDTTLGNNSFSVQININLIKEQITKSREDTRVDNKLSTQVNNTQRVMSASKPGAQSHNANILKSTDEDELSNKQPPIANKLSGIK